jgi:nicotinamide-nucleotide amidase
MDEQGQLAARVAEAAQGRGASVGVAESMTGGMVACRLSAAPAAEAMAAASAKLLRATVVVSLTGSGGPEPQDGQAPGTVWFGLFRDGEVIARRRCFNRGDPRTVCEDACTEALRLTIELLEQ